MAPAGRPMVSVRGADGAAVEQAALPEVFRAPLRPDLVATVHRDLAKNARQAQGVNRLAGHQHSAESWGTGRAVSRIPRVAGSGTHAAGAGAFGNMCRGGRMFAPTKTWRKWHRKVAKGQRRYAVRPRPPSPPEPRHFCTPPGPCNNLSDSIRWPGHMAPGPI